MSRPRAAYVHVPFCRHRCGYCNFTLIAGRDDLHEDYLRAIDIELASHGKPSEVDTLFFGGGTPTRLTPAQLRRLIESVRRQFPLAPGYEFSVEANPADLDEPMLAALVECGVNRVSLGGQSFQPQKLARLERDHSPDQLRRVVVAAKEQFPSVSLDLIFSAPGETLVSWQSDLAAAIALAPQHVSTYALTYEQGTSFWNRLERGLLARLDEEVERDMYAAALDTLSAAGYEHYEVSNFAKAGHRCRHNETYWSGREYWAVGPGAARYVNGRREMNHQSTTTWLKRVLAGRSPIAESETLGTEDRAREFLVFALRRLEGIERQAFADQTGCEIDSLVGDPLEQMVALSLLSDDGCRIKLTRAGLFVSDSIWPKFLRP